MDGFGDALLGTVLLAQLPVQLPEVLFFVPGDDKEDGEASSEREDGPESPDDLEPESSRDDFSILRARNLGAPVMSSAEDLNRHSLQYFGVPSTTLAKLMIPMSEGQICNQLTISEVDAGKFEYAHRHNTKENHDHLLFVSYPCGFAKIADRDPEKWEKQLPKSQLVQCFNIVHVLDSKTVSRLEARVRVLGEATQLVQERLCIEEVQKGYVSWEVRRLKEQIRAKSTGEQVDVEVVESPHPLEKLIRDLYNRMKESGSAKLEVNGEDLYRIHDFPEDAEEVSELQGISLFRSHKDVDSEFPPDTDSSIRVLVQKAKPWLSIAELSNETQLDIPTLQRAAQHLIVKKKAKVVNVFRKHTRVALAQGIDTSKDSTVAQHFAEWRKKHDPEKGKPLSKKKEAREQKNSKTTFTEALTLFHKGMEIKKVQKQFLNEAEFQMILGYLVAQGFLVQLGQFCHFMPHRDKGRPTSTPAPNCDQLRAAHVWRAPFAFDPAVHLKENEFLVLESRTSDPDVLRFFVEFVLRIARPHKRLDSVAFDDLLKEFGGPPVASSSSERRVPQGGEGGPPPMARLEEGAVTGASTATEPPPDPDSEEEGPVEKWSLRWALGLLEEHSDVFVLYRSRS